MKLFQARSPLFNFAHSGGELVATAQRTHRLSLQSGLFCTSSSAAAARRGTGTEQEGPACQHLYQTASRLIFGFVVGAEMFI